MTRRKPFAPDLGGIRGHHVPKRGNIFIYIILLIAVVAAMISLSRTGRNPSKNVSIMKQTNDFFKEGELELYNENDSLIISIDIEIADDEAQIQKGLMHRRSMEERQGMLFIYAEPEPRSFWMKNTQIPLDIIFLDENKKIVSIQENTRPLSEESIPSVYPAQYILEVNAGFSARHFIKPGHRMVFVRTY